MKVIVEADGGARGNPGPAGYGAVVRDASNGSVLAERAEALGVTTNNVAEYSGLIAGLTAARELGAAQVEVRMDSKLVIEQMTGRWQIKHPGLRLLAAQAAELQSQFDQVRYEWIPRERNKHADALANMAMDGAQPAAATWEPRADVATRLILVRHGETSMTAEKRYSGRGDVPLSEAGRAQAQAVAARVAALAPVAAVSSPLARCAQTAALIGVPVSTEADLIECDFGDWEGMTFAEVRERYGPELNAWLGSTAVAPPGGESFKQVSARVRRALDHLRKNYPGQTVAVVSHVSPIKLLLRDALAASDALLHRLFLDPAGLSIVDYYPDGGVAVRTVNDVAHLE
ncbi:bifunctional RNase H/acid phosphatase [Rhizocola hellebori]|uniref:Bifunctional RNase H/acid phosphatase n=1 Tax=Rhizocola hellebori TaxID=1392758 RepID=A0A8J3Q5S1_9ACTN|nr:histidine phosphatase family protein [Rhizocola hellebori]GIH04548.1 bifunctional RNase H/acid phosphatase [Rhizocola hellebori]